MSVLVLPDRQPTATVAVIGTLGRRTSDVVRLLRADELHAALTPADPPSVGTAVLCVVDDEDAAVATLESSAGCDDRAVAVGAVVAADSPARTIRRLIRAGVRGVVREGDLEATLAVTVRAASSGQIAIPASVASPLGREPLSHREREVLNLVALGCTNREIADRMYVAESTVKSHLSSVFAKLNITSRSEAAALVLESELGFSDPDARTAVQPAELAAVRSNGGSA